MVCDKLDERSKTPHRKLYLRLEVDSVDFDDFMARKYIQNKTECVSLFVACLNNITLQLVEDFFAESNKTTYLLNALLGRKWATTLLNNISTDQYLLIN